MSPPRLSSLALCLALVSTLGADTVVLKSGARFDCEIVRKTSHTLTIRFARNGREKTYSMEQVARIQFMLPPLMESANQQFTRGQFKLAADGYRFTLEARHSPWIEQMAYARLILAELHQQRWSEAIDAYLNLLRDYPGTDDFVLIPLPFKQDEAVLRAAVQRTKWRALQGTQIRQEAGRLIAAALAISAKQPAEAERMLAGLRESGRPGIADLAQIQQWRLQLLAEEAGDHVEDWTSDLLVMGAAARPAGYFVLGQAYEKNGRWTDAALCYLRVLIVYSANPALASEACVSAARALKQAGQTEEANKLFQECRDRFPHTPAALLAAQETGA